MLMLALAVAWLIIIGLVGSTLVIVLWRVVLCIDRRTARRIDTED